MVDADGVANGYRIVSLPHFSDAESGRRDGILTKETQTKLATAGGLPARVNNGPVGSSQSDSLSGGNAVYWEKLLWKWMGMMNHFMSLVTMRSFLVVPCGRLESSLRTAGRATRQPWSVTRFLSISAITF